MPKTNVIYISLFGLFLIYFGYTVFLADNALVKRTVTTHDENGGYQRITTKADGSKLIETYEVSEQGTPLSHKLILQGTEPGSEPKVMKSGSFVPKFKEES